MILIHILSDSSPDNQMAIFTCKVDNLPLFPNFLWQMKTQERESTLVLVRTLLSNILQEKSEANALKHRKKENSVNT